jgi:lipopolysaccharide-induced tumor necrosis factor-alpha factor
MDTKTPPPYEAGPADPVAPAVPPPAPARPTQEQPSAQPTMTMQYPPQPIAMPVPSAQTIYVASSNEPVQYVVRDEMLYIPVDAPLRIYCPYDRKEVVTQIERRPGFLACCCATLLCFTCLWPCFFLPFCSRGCLDRHHVCPHCRNVLAVIPA